MRIISRIAQIGTALEGDLQEKRRIVFSNQLTMIMLSAVTVMIGQLLIVEGVRDALPLFLTFLTMGLFAACFWLNAQGHHRSMRVLLIGTANIGILGSVFIVGNQNMTELLFLPLASIPIAFLSSKHKGSLYLMCVMSVGFLLLSKPIKENIQPLVHLSKDAVDAGAYLFYLVPSVALVAALTWWHRGAMRLQLALEAEKNRSQRLLLNILPPAIAGRLLDGERLIADRHEHSTVLFADLVGFTPLSATLPPERIVSLLNEIFSQFDVLCEKHSLEKIKTIGDSYMAVAGVPSPEPNHAAAAAEAALEMLEVLKQVARAWQLDLNLRIGLHSGPIVAGVIGERKFIYDLWGDTVNLASRMESHGLPGEVHITADIAKVLGDGYELHPRGELEIKGRGSMPTFFLRRRPIVRF